MIPVHWPYIQSAAAIVTPRELARIKHRLDVLELELAPLGWRRGLMLHDEIQYDGPARTRAQADLVLARHAMCPDSTRWCFELADGSRVSGCVQGCGGIVEYTGGRERLGIAQQRAREGDPLPIYEPKPGHIRLYPNYNAHGQGDPVDLDLRTARLL